MKNSHNLRIQWIRLFSLISDVRRYIVNSSCAIEWRHFFSLVFPGGTIICVCACMVAWNTDTDSWVLTLWVRVAAPPAGTAGQQESDDIRLIRSSCQRVRVQRGSWVSLCRNSESVCVLLLLFHVFINAQFSSLSSYIASRSHHDAGGGACWSSCGSGAHTHVLVVLFFRYFWINFICSLFPNMAVWGWRSDLGRPQHCGPSNKCWGFLHRRYAGLRAALYPDRDGSNVVCRGGCGFYSHCCLCCSVMSRCPVQDWPCPNQAQPRAGENQNAISSVLFVFFEQPNVATTALHQCFVTSDEGPQSAPQKVGRPWIQTPSFTYLQKQDCCEEKRRRRWTRRGHRRWRQPPFSPAERSCRCWRTTSTSPSPRPPKSLVCPHRERRTPLLSPSAPPHLQNQQPRYRHRCHPERNVLCSWNETQPDLFGFDLHLVWVCFCSCKWNDFYSWPP